MAKHLVIVESPAKAKTINQILGRDFVVKASMGHVRDLPQKQLGVAIQDRFKPRYVTVKGHEKIVRELKDIASQGEDVFLAPDPDREGEAIAWHLQAALKGTVPSENFYRVTYNEITPRAVKEAFAHPSRIDMNKVNSQQARRVLDRIVGYLISPLLWRIRRGLSAGRVQSVALRLVCEREEAIRVFTPEAYWLLGAKVKKQTEPATPFEIRLLRIRNEKANVKTQEQVDAIRQDLQGRVLRVAAVAVREFSKKAYPPYITSTLQQAASSCFGFSPSRTMAVAQKLYEGVDLGDGPIGLITYMRTDSFTVSRDAQQACRELIREQFGEAYVPESPNVYRRRQNAQEAHEAIRPTDARRTPESLSGRLSADELKLYGLIRQRFISSQMTPARISLRTVDIEAVPPSEPSTPYLFRASSSEIIFPGYMKVSGIEKTKTAEDEHGIETLPPLTQGECLDVLEWLAARKETQPPPRYSEASLIKALEEHGIGRPSTYASILSTLNQRAYVTRDKRTLRPTDLGIQVNQFLVTHLDALFNVKFTAGMEESLDAVENGKVEWTAMLDEFYRHFEPWLNQAKGPASDPAKVLRILTLFDSVGQWAPPVQRGKRTYSDQHFVESVKKQLQDGKKPISSRQEEALTRIAWRYKNQIPSITDVLGSEPEPNAQLKPSTRRKLELLSSIRFEPVTESSGVARDDKAFVDSLTAQAQSGRVLSPAQIGVLDRMIFKYADQIPDLNQILSELDLQKPEPVDLDLCRLLLELMQSVHQWKPAFKRGRREWDDRAFYESLSRQFSSRGALSPKQVASLKKLVRKYREQIDRFEAVSASLGLPPHAEKKTGSPLPSGSDAHEGPA